MPMTMNAIRNRDGNADLDDQRHAAPRARVAASVCPFLSDIEADDLADGVAPSSPSNS